MLFTRIVLLITNVGQKIRDSYLEKQHHSRQREPIIDLIKFLANSDIYFSIESR